MDIKKVKSIFFYTGIINCRLTIDEIFEMAPAADWLATFLDETLSDEQRIKANVELVKEIYEPSELKEVISQLRYKNSVVGTCTLIITDLDNNKYRYEIEDNKLIVEH